MAAATRLWPVSDLDSPGPEPAATLQAVAAGDYVVSVVTAAFDQHAARLKGFAYASVRDADEAEDVVQEAYVRLVTEVQAHRVPDNVGSWLFRVCGNLLASRGRHRSVVERAKPFLVERGVGRSPEDATIERETDATLAAALARLPPAMRVALLMAASGEGSAAIGATIGRSEGATRTLICRGRLRLREAMATEEGTR